MFLTETDTKAVMKETDYQIAGYDTILPLRNKSSNHIRIIALVKQKIKNLVEVRTDLMSEDFPSIWLEIKENIKGQLWCLDSIVNGHTKE